MALPKASSGKAVVKTVRFDQKLADKVAAYRAATGLSEAESIRTLIEAGLMTQGMELYSTPLARFVRELMQGQLDLFRDELDQRNDEMEERVAKICAKGAKASLQSAVMQVDVMRGLFPAMGEVPEEQIWKAYQQQAGQLQEGISFHDVKAALGNG